MIPGCGARWAAMIWLGTMVPGLAGEAPVGASIPLQEPPLKVREEVPILKVGEYQMLTRRFAPAAVAYQDALYIFGGTDGDRPVAEIERFDLKTHESRVVGKLKVPRFWHGGAVVGTKAYIVGGVTITDGTGLEGLARKSELIREHGKRMFATTGRDDSAEIMMERGGADGVATVETFDLETSQVGTTGDIPQMIAQFGIVAVDGRIITFGGRGSYRGGSAFVNPVHILDTTTGKWTSGSPAPHPRAAAAALTPGGLVVYAGGWDGRQGLKDVDVYNPRENTWRQLPPLSRQVSAHSMVYAAHYVFLFGDYATPDELVTYDLLTRKSETFTLQYTPSRHGAAVAVGDRIYVIGGRETKFADPTAAIQEFQISPKAMKRAAAVLAGTAPADNGNRR